MATVVIVRRLVPKPSRISQRTARSSLIRGFHEPRLLGIRTELAPQPLSLTPASAAPSARRSIFSVAAAALGQAAGPNGKPHKLSTIRTLPYAASDLFDIIADVDSYDDFLPHCTLSRVTAWRKGSISQESAGPTYPSEADLTVGWGPLLQTYSSRVYCVPKHGVVEAVSGRSGVPTLTAEERAAIGLGKDSEDSKRAPASAPPASAAGARRPTTPEEDDTFESLVTRWKVMPFSATNSPAAAPSSDWTRVELQIRFQFRNPLYQIAAAQVGNEMATKMIEAFEKRTVAILGPRSPQSRQGRL